MEIDEMLNVIQAWKDGKVIEVREIPSGEWMVNRNPVWNFNKFEYRVKPDEIYRGYLNAEELDADIIKHGALVIFVDSSSSVWRRMIIEYNSETIYIGSARVPLNRAHVSGVRFLDGTPLGVKVEQ